MANRDIKTVMKDSSGVVLSGVAKTATFNSQGYSLNGLEYFGIVLDMGVVTGTTPTLNIAVSTTLDGGTTWIDTFPATVNVENLAGEGTNRAILAEIATSDVDTAKYWQNWLPNDNDAQIRFEFTVAGTSPSFTITNAYFVARRFGKY
jgi:hypothetical protein